MRYSSVFLSFLMGISYAGSAIGQSFIVERQFGQATNDTCQSYVLAIALAFKNDSNFKMKDWAELRKMENLIRTEVKKNMDARSANLASPEDSKKAIEYVTQGKYTLNYKDDALDPADFQKKIKDTTGVSSRSAFDNVPSFLVGSIVKDVIITSALRIAAKSYKSGHQFAILGVSSSVPSSKVEYLVLNSAARGKNASEKQIDVCEVGVPDEKSPYFASLGWTSDIEFNPPGGKMRAWQIVTK